MHTHISQASALDKSRQGLEINRRTIEAEMEVCKITIEALAPLVTKNEEARYLRWQADLRLIALELNLQNCR
jgi:hypothetical protein